MAEPLHVVSPQGQVGTVDETDAQQLPLGWRPATREEVAAARSDAAYAQKSTGEKIAGYAQYTGVPAFIAANLATGGKAAAPPELEAYLGGVSNSLTGGLAQAAVKEAKGAVGGAAAGKAYAQQVADSKAAHENLDTAGQVAGFFGGAASGGPKAGLGKAAALIPGAGASMVGGVVEHGVAGALGGVAAKGVAGRAVAAGASLATRGAVEGALYGAAGQVSEDVLGDHQLAADKLFIAAGLGALGGAAAGGVLGAGGSLASSGAGAVAGKVRGRVAAQVATSPAAEVIATPKGRVSIDPDAGLKAAPEAAEQAFSFGPEKRPIHIKPQGRPGVGPVEEPFSISRSLHIDPDAGLHAPTPSADETPLFSRFTQGGNKDARRAAVAAGLEEGAEKGHEVNLAANLFRAPKAGEIRVGPRPIESRFDVGFDPEAGIGARDGSGHFQGKSPAGEDAFRLSSKRNVARDVLLGDVEGAAEREAAPGLRIEAPPVSSEAMTPTSSSSPGLRALLGQFGEAATQKGLAYDQAWKAVGAGFGLQSTRYAKQAAKYFPNGTRDLGEVAIRHGIIDVNPGASVAEASFNAARNGTPAELLSRIQAADASVGARIGEITDASGARIPLDEVARAIDSVRAGYDKIAGRGHEVNALDAYKADLLEKLARAAGPDGTVPLQAALAQRKGLDEIVYQEAKTLDPRGRVAALREVRTGLEDVITKRLDEASGKVPGSLAVEYKTLKKDFHALRILGEAAEDSASRAAKGRSLSLTDTIAAGAGIASGHLLAGPVLGLGHKIIRERGNAAAAVLLYRMSEMGTLTRAVQAVDAAITRAAEGAVAPRKLPPLPSSAVPVTKRAQDAMRAVAQAQTNPEAVADAMADKTGHIAKVAPNVAGAVTQRLASAAAFLAAKMPPTAEPDPFRPGQAPRVSTSDAATFLRYYDYAQQPMRFYAEVERGRITHEGAETAQALTPQAFAELQTKTGLALADYIASGHQVPFATQERLGVLLNFAATPSQKVPHMRLLQANVQGDPGADKLPPNAAPSRPLPSSSQRSPLDRIEGA